MKIIDLFSGVGGLSLGAARAGFDIAAAVEIDTIARQTHKLNFPLVRHVSESVALLSGRRLLELADIAKGETFGLIGGPPCQGFSDIGLKSAADPRNELLVHFFRLVAETNPAFFLAENVPGVLSPRNGSLLQRAMDVAPARYRLLPPLKIRAQDYGVPTTRTRVFFIGYDPDRLAALTQEDFSPVAAEDIRVKDALQGIGSIRSSWQSEPSSWRVVGEVPLTAYGERIMGHIPIGIGNSAAINRLRNQRKVSGFLGTLHTEETIRRFRALKPGERDPISKASRLDKNGYCPTLRAGTGPERGSYQAIRPVHPTVPRVISPREAARLQGFPDWFQFHPTKWHAFRQIGNSVSPIVAERILKVIASSI